MTARMTEVALIFYDGRIEHWLRFGTQGASAFSTGVGVSSPSPPARSLPLCVGKRMTTARFCRVSTFCGRARLVRSFLQYPA